MLTRAAVKNRAITNTVEIRFEGKGGLAYQIVGSYFIPWDEKPANEALSINVAYDRTHLAQDDIAAATATIKNNLPKTANMVMVDLGIPPGFDLLSEDLQAYVEKSASQKNCSPGKIQSDGDAGHSLFQLDCTGADGHVALPPACQVSYPRPDFPVPSL